MNKISYLLVVAVLVLTASCGKIGKSKLSNEKDSVTYMIGLSVAKDIKNNLNNSDFGKVDPNIIARAFKEVFSGDSIKITDAQIQRKLQEYFMKLQTQVSEKNLKEGKEFLEKNKKAPGVQVRPSGLQYQVLKEGNGATPDSTDQVLVNYKGTLINGEVFDSRDSVEMPVAGGIISGWSEALLNMKVGSKWRIFVPSELGFGERGGGGKIKPNAAVIFEIELLKIMPKQAPKK